MESVQLPHNRSTVLVLEDRTFHRKVLSKLYLIANLIFSQTLVLFCQPHKIIRLSKNLVKDVQGFG